ncbi:MAG TPA: hypothetical protein VFZ73_03440 [Gemmatimonadaceae bacterium]
MIVLVTAVMLMVHHSGLRQTPACSTVVTTPWRLELDDGRIVSAELRSLAGAGTSTLALGRHAYLFPASADPRTPPQAVDSIIGVELDAGGRVAPVRNPALPGRVFHPRAAAIAGGNGAYHVMWVTGLDSVSHVPDPDEQVSLWYARYARGNFAAPQRVGSFRGARLHPEVSSALLDRDGELALAFPFARGPLDGGVILLRGRNGAWRADTLHTSYSPHAVQVAHGRRGMVAIIALTDASRQMRHEALFSATFDSTWSRPILLAADPVHLVTQLELSRLGDDFVASWITWRIFDTTTSRLHWMRLDATGRARSSGLVDAGTGTYPYAMTLLDGQWPLWLYRGEPSGTTIALRLLRDTTLLRLPSVTAPFRNPVAATVAVSPTRFLVFTQKLPLSDHEPMAASFVTEIEIRCPSLE